MKKVDRILYCETCDEGIAYIGTDKEILSEMRKVFQKHHDHESREWKKN